MKKGIKILYRKRPNKKLFCKRGHLKDENNTTSNSTCRKCMSILGKERYLKNAEARRAYSRIYSKSHSNMWLKWHLKKNYGLSLERYKELEEIQKGVCSICFKPPKRNRLVVDHNHETGQIRGLLCDVCNRIVLPVVERYENLILRSKEYLNELKSPTFFQHNTNS